MKRAGVVVSPLRRERRAGGQRRERPPLLMDSPAHRANMLGAKFTHVGIGVGVRPGEAGDLLATLVFARRPPPPSAPLTPAVATTFISSLRRAKGAGADRRRSGAAKGRRGRHRLPDGQRRRDARSGHRRRADGAGRRVAGASTSAAARSASSWSRSSSSTSSSRIPCLQPRPMKLGLATATKTDRTDAFKIFVLVLAEGATCQ